MDVIACTLLADGSSDRVLLPILQGLLDKHCPAVTELHFAEYLPHDPKGLANRISAALNCYPCDLLFVHRDAEAASPEDRKLEIEVAWAKQGANQRWVPIVPVRMTEAWLLLDESAIRAAAGNPNGTAALKLPPAHEIESRKDPKEDLFSALRIASELRPGRLKDFAPEKRRHRVSELMNSFEPLRALPSFLRLEASLKQIFQK